MSSSFPPPAGVPSQLRPRVEPKFSIPPGRPTTALTFALMGAALASSYAIAEPLERTIVQGALVVVIHLVGLFQPRPR